MKGSFVVSALLSATISCIAESARPVASGVERPSKPNIVLLLTDDRDWRWFRSEIVGHVELKAGADQALGFEVTEPVSEARMPSYLADDKPGTEHDGFMLKSITLKSLAPLPYG